MAACGLAHASGCGDPCRELSEKICACAQGPLRRRMCAQGVEALAAQWNKNRRGPASSPNAAAESAGRQVCAELLPGCTCAVLRAGNLQACGLATAPAPP